MSNLVDFLYCLCLGADLQAGGGADLPTAGGRLCPRLQVRPLPWGVCRHQVYNSNRITCCACASPLDDVNICDNRQRLL